MIRLTFDIELGYEIIGFPSDFIFNIHAAKTPQQAIISEQLTLNQPVTPAIFTDPTFGTRYMRLNASPGSLTVHYGATVDLTHHAEQPENLYEVPIAQLPPEVLRYIYPSRYCQSDRFGRLATWEFAHFPPGYARVAAIQDWVRRRTAFLSGSTNSNTSAADTVVEQAGVCRDFAHLMIALCRAMNIPARFVTGIDYGAAPEPGSDRFSCLRRSVFEPPLVRFRPHRHFTSDGIDSPRHRARRR